MSKVKIIQLDSVTHNDSSATAAINSNFQALQEAIENTLSRDGSVPNYMNANLDMNSFRIINGSTAVDDSDYITKGEFDEKVGNAAEYAQQAQESANQAANSALAAGTANSNAQTAAENVAQNTEIVQALTDNLPVVKNNTSVSTWVSSVDYDDYPLQATVLFPVPDDVKAINIISVAGFVVFSIDDVLSGNYAPVSKFILNDDKQYVSVTVYAKEQPETTLTIPSILYFYIKE